MARQDTKPHRKVWWAAWLGVFSMGLVLVVVGSQIVIQSQSVEAEGASPVVVATPSASPTVTATATPTAAPTPEPTETAQVAQCPSWQFPATTLSIPSVGLDLTVTEYTPEDRINNGGQIIPPEKDSIVWDSWYCYRQGIDSIPSASASTCFYVAGHSYKDGSAPFNQLVNVEVGDTAVITTSTGETLTYVRVRPEDQILKSTQTSDENLYPSTPQPGCLKLVTCLSEGERDASGHSIALRVATFQLVPPSETTTLDSTASRLQ